LTFIPTTKDKKEQAKEKDAYLKSFKYKPIEALVIKLADRICNVLDYKLTDPGYAVIYFNKAKCLFEFYQERRNEVVAQFGEVCDKKITVSINSVINCLKNKNDHELIKT